MTKIKDAEIVTRETSPVGLPQIDMQLIVSEAIKKESPTEVMRELFAYQREREDKYAREQYGQAMAEFQAECPTIEKTRQGNKSKFASLDDIVGQTKELRTRHGFSFRFEEDADRVACVVTHKNGHSERSTFPIMAEKIMSKAGGAVRSANQDYAAALTFAKRYAFCNAFGIMTGDADTDAIPTAEQRAEDDALVERIEAVKTKEEFAKLLAEMKAEGKTQISGKVGVAYTAKRKELGI
jgi:hypothetical protein